MTTAYQRGYKAGLNGDPPDACPYSGTNAGSRLLRQRWFDGHFEGCFHVTPKHHGRTYRKQSRKRWPKNLYARERVKKALKAPIR